MDNSMEIVELALVSEATQGGTTISAPDSVSTSTDSKFP
jgi:hypothetical protein